MDDPLTKIDEERVFGIPVRWAIYLPAAAMGGLAFSNYIQAFASPKLIENGHGSTANGKIGEVVVSLKDPSVIDRLMASLPSLAIGLSILFLSAYLLRSNYRMVAKGIHGENPSRMALLLGGGAWLALTVGNPFLTGFASGYFGVKDVAMDDFSLVIGTLFLIIIDGLVAKSFWNKEHGRAEGLNEKMKDVV